MSTDLVIVTDRPVIHRNNEVQLYSEAGGLKRWLAKRKSVRHERRDRRRAKNNGVSWWQNRHNRKVERGREKEEGLSWWERLFSSSEEREQKRLDRRNRRIERRGGGYTPPSQVRESRPITPATSANASTHKSLTPVLEEAPTPVQSKEVVTPLDPSDSVKVDDVVITPPNADSIDTRDVTIVDIPKTKVQEGNVVNIGSEGTGITRNTKIALGVTIGIIALVAIVAISKSKNTPK